MNPGIYSMTFKSSLGYFGEGWALMDKGKVYGGDNRYLYRGRYENAEDSLKAEVRVSLYRHRDKPVSIFGFFEQFDLKLLGHSKGDEFTLMGEVVTQPILSITIEGKKIADLIS